MPATKVETTREGTRVRRHQRPGFLAFNRPPRLSEAIEHTVVTIPAPPVPPSSQTSLVSTLGMPALTFLVMFVILLPQITNPNPGNSSSGGFLFATLAMSSVYLIGSLWMVGNEWRSNRKLRRQQTAEYRELLSTTEQTLLRMASQERERRADLDPPVQELYNRAADPTNPSPRLWERRTANKDFLQVRIGVGSLPSSTQVVVTPPSTPTPSDMSKEAEALAARFANVDLAPLTVDFKSVGSVGVAGPVAMSCGLVNSLLCQVIAHHTPVDVRIVALYPAEHSENWEWLKWAPHTEPVRGGDMSERALASTPERARQALRQVQDELSTRERRLAAQQGSTPDPAKPCLLVLLDGDDLLEDSVITESLLSRGPQLNVFTIYLSRTVSLLPSQCGAVITVGDTPDYPCTYRVVGTGQRASGEMDCTAPQTAEAIARALGPLQVSTADRTNGIPDNLRLLDLLGISDPANADIASLWGKRDSKSHLRIPVGQGGGEKTLYLSLRSDSAEGGPHGIVGGMTGSGKSELLRSVVAAFSATHHPHKLNFVLVDYKGGSAFQGLDELPHVVGFVTNLDEHLAERALVALQSELKDRQRRLRAAGVDSVADYQELQEHDAARKLAPLPNLVIVVDEFAQLKEEVPDFIQGLIGIARIGRSLGVHLLLATQRPAGVVTDEIRANTSYKICLRVADAQDSSEVIGSPEAALLPSTVPGRAFIQIGSEQIVAFQAGRITTPYTQQSAKNAIPIEDFMPSSASEGQREVSGGGAMVLTKWKETELDVLVQRIVAVAAGLGVERLRSPWPPPLSAGIELRDVLPSGLYPEDPQNQYKWPPQPPGGWLVAPIGLLDEPEQQRQTAFTLNLAEAGHALAFGMSRSGKSTLLRSAATSLALSHSPADLHLYCIDCGRGALAPLGELPHCGGVLYPGDVEKVIRLIADLRRDMADRAQELQRTGVFTLTEYLSSARRTRHFPYIVVLLDNFTTFRETFLGDNAVLHMDQAGKLLSDLTALVREGQAVGIHLVMTVDSWNVISRYPALLNAIGLRLALRQSDEVDYTYIGMKGREGMVVPPGRGFMGGASVLEFQVAIPASPRAMPEEQEHSDVESRRAASLAWLKAKFTGQATGPRPEFDQPQVPVEWLSSEEQTASLSELCCQLKASWPHEPVSTVRSLPDIVPLQGLLALSSDADSGQHGLHCVAPIGLDDRDLLPFMMAVGSDSPTFLVAGPARSGKSTLLLSIILSLASRYPPNRVRFAVAGLRRSPVWDIAGLPHLFGNVAKTATELEGLLERLVVELDGRQGEGGWPPATMDDGRQTTDDGSMDDRRQTTDDSNSIVHRPSSIVRSEATIVLVIDDLEELLISGSNALQMLFEIGRRGRTLGLNIVAAGLTQELSRSYDQSIEYLRRGQTGFLLCPNFREDGDLLNVRLPIMSHRAFPAGRGFFVHRGWTLTHAATPLREGLDIEQSVKAWVGQIAKG